MEDLNNDILNSLEGMERAKPPVDLLARIQGDLEVSEVVARVKWQLVAASVAVILACNLYAVKKHLDQKDESVQIEAPFANNFNIYGS